MSIFGRSSNDPTESETAQLQTQKPSDGVGPLYHRVYSIDVETNWANAMRVLNHLKSDINHYSPTIMCRFEKTCGTGDALKIGDEFQIHITGPWNGPVRVKDVTENSFTFSTLEGHMEAGEIQFRMSKIDSENTRFEIESVARSSDHLVDLVYDKIPIAKIAQTEMWRSVCESVGNALSSTDGKKDEGKLGEIQTLTERRDEETGKWQTL